MRRKSHPLGFTLVELMISIAIALLLVLGVNQIFKITSQAVGAGESVLSSSRDARTVLQTLLADMNAVDPCPYGGSSVGDAPCFIIRSEHIGAYRNSTDWQAATDQTKPYHDDLLFANLNGSHEAPVTFTNLRSHRVDRVGFFEHQSLFARQTSSDGITYVAPAYGNNGVIETGIEAWVLYGHSQQPNNTVITGANTTDWRDPGSQTNATNDHNYYASDWMLTRMAMILNPNPNASGSYNYIKDTGGLSPYSKVQASALSSSILLENAVLDVAGPLSIASWGSSARSTPGIYWYGIDPAITGGKRGSDWWTPLINYRFQVGPYMLSTVGGPTGTVKISPYGLGKCAPNLIRGCSQFIVEFAGSYYTKNRDGSPAATLSNGAPQTIPTPDGQLDFAIIDPRTGLPPAPGVTGIRQIRWYGYPRSVITPAVPLTGNLNPEAGDVVPLRDVLAHLGSSIAQPAWATYSDAERFSGNFPSASTGANYTPYSSISAMDPATDQNSSTSSHYNYTAAWGPDVRFTPFPKLIRIIIGIDDHEGRLNQPQFYEFVYPLRP